MFLTSCENLLPLVLFVACLISLSLLTSSFHLGLQGSLLAIQSYIMENNTSHDYNLDVFSPILSFLVNDSHSTFDVANALSNQDLGGKAESPTVAKGISPCPGNLGT